ncbi:MAG: amidohydrolase [Saprospiraceae bacterium]|nr:amidohydrolase [Saprospiraceae bacterium]
MTKRLAHIWYVLIMLVLANCQQTPPAQNADLIITGKIWTADRDAPTAHAMAVAGDTILVVGSEAMVMKFRGQDTEIMHLDSGLVVPGFIDCHVHFMSGSYGLSMVKLRDAASPAQFIKRLATFTGTVPAGTWITEGDWDHELWGGTLPHRDWIDSVTADHPVFVSRLDGHMALVNTAALRAAGVSDAIADVAGGTIVRDAEGRLTGVLKDNAMALVSRHIPPPDHARQDQALQAGMRFVAAQGVTSAHNMDIAGPEVLDVFRRAHAQDKLLTRFYVAVGLSDWQALRDMVAQSGTGDEWLRIGVLKGMVDGSLGSHTAAFHAPFTDTPDDRGLLLQDMDLLRTWIDSADRAGLHLAIHAIGDRANHQLLNMFEEIAEQNGLRDRRFRIEHAQHLAPEDIPRLAELKVVASMQPYHAIDDGRWAEKVIGPERVRTTYAFRSILDAGAHLAFGSDWAVAPPTPLEGIYAAVTRRTLDDANPDGWVPEQKITVEEALYAYTTDGAFASFEEKIKGSLAPGKLADLVILDRDLLTIAPQEIRNVQVMRTMVGGRWVYIAE